MIVEVDDMNLKDADARFTVYRHTSPNGKQYVGITSKPVEERWGKSGCGYIDNKHLWSAICKYGWDSFIHEILACDLSLEDACSLECYLIATFDLMNPDKGYNQTSGGQYSVPSDEIRAVLSERTSSKWKDPEFRSKIVNKLKGHPVSQETRAKISEANTGRLLGHVSPLKGRTLSKEHVDKLRGRSAWNKGLTKHTHPSIFKGSCKLLHRVKSDSEIHNISASRKAMYDNGYCPVWINNGKIETTIDMSCQLLPQGFEFGRLDRGYKYICKDGVTKKVPDDELDNWISSGWSLGRGSVMNIKKARQEYVWMIHGLEFCSAADVATYLNSHGYPDIVASTVTSLYKKGFENSKKYSSLSGELSRRPVDHEDTKD